jgi:hypothetical protein
MEDLTKTVIQDPKDWEKWERDPKILGKVQCLWFRLKYGDRTFVKITASFLALVAGGSVAILFWNANTGLARSDWEREHLARIKFAQSIFAFDGRFKPDSAEMGIASQAAVNLAIKINKSIEQASAANKKPCQNLGVNECTNAIVSQNLNEVEELKQKPTTATFKVTLTRDEAIAIKSLRAVATDLSRYPQVKSWNAEIDNSLSLEAFEELTAIRAKEEQQAASNGKSKPRRQSLGRQGKVAENPEDEQ